MITDWISAVPPNRSTPDAGKVRLTQASGAAMTGT